MDQKTEALYLINGDKFLHLRENGAGVGFATYNCATGEPQEFGQISKQNLPPDGRNAIPAARNWYLFELSSDIRKAIQEVSLQHLDTIPQSGVRRRRIWDDPTIPRDDVRLINSHYDDLYRVPNHGHSKGNTPDGEKPKSGNRTLKIEYHSLGQNNETSVTRGPVIKKTGWLKKPMWSGVQVPTYRGVFQIQRGSRTNRLEKLKAKLQSPPPGFF